MTGTSKGGITDIGIVIFWCRILMFYMPAIIFSFPGVIEAPAEEQACPAPALPQGGRAAQPVLCGTGMSSVLSSNDWVSARGFYPRLEVHLILGAYIIKKLSLFHGIYRKAFFHNCSFTVVYIKKKIKK